MSRRWALVLWGLVPAVACGGGSDQRKPPPGASGSAGTAGAQGSAGSGGAGATGASGGGGGTGGTPDAGATGGTGASGGSAGSGGSGGSSGDSTGGSGGSGASDGGTPDFLTCPNPELITVAGADESGDVDGAGGPSGPARFYEPKGMVAFGTTGLLVADSRNDKIRRVEVAVPALTVTVSTLEVTFNGTPAGFSGPDGVVTVLGTDVLISDQYNQRIRRYSQGTITTLSGDGNEGLQNGQGTGAQFHYPRGIALGQDRALYIADNGNHAVRRMSETSEVMTVAGDGTRGFVNGALAEARFAFPNDVAVGPDGAIYVADGGNHAIRKIMGGMVSTLAGTGTSGFTDAAGDSARFAAPEGVAVHPDGRVFVADHDNQRIRLINASGTVTTLTGSGPEATPSAVDGPPGTARLLGPRRVAITAVGLAITDGNRVRLLVCR